MEGNDLEDDDQFHKACFIIQKVKLYEAFILSIDLRDAVSMVIVFRLDICI